MQVNRVKKILRKGGLALGTHVGVTLAYAYQDRNDDHVPQDDEWIARLSAASNWRRSLTLSDSHGSSIEMVVR